MLNKEWCSSPQALAVGHVAYPEWTSDPMVMAKGNEMGWAGWNITADAAGVAAVVDEGRRQVNTLAAKAYYRDCVQLQLPEVGTGMGWPFLVPPLARSSQVQLTNPSGPGSWAAATRSSPMAMPGWTARSARAPPPPPAAVISRAASEGLEPGLELVCQW